MVKRLALLASLTLLLGAAFVPTAHASTRFSFQIGVAPGPAPGYVWQEGYYAWSGFRYRWVPGEWIPAPYGRRDWEAERSDRDHRDFHRDWEGEHRDFHRDGDWRNDRDRREWDRDRDLNRERDRNWDRDDRGWRR